MTDEWTTGGYHDPADELEARRQFMAREGYSPCNIAACNCGSWHRNPTHKERRLVELVECLLDNDPSDYAADAVTVLDVWREDAKRILGRER